MTLDDEILTALRRIIRATDQHSRALLTRHGLTGPQWAALRILAEEGDRSVGDLAVRIHVSQPTVTGIVGRLERRGLVVRSRYRFDRRKVMVAATEEGRTALASAPPLLQERLRSRLEALEDWERTLILSSLQRVVGMMEATDLDASPMLVTGPIHAEPDLEPASGDDDR